MRDFAYIYGVHFALISVQMSRISPSLKAISLISKALISNFFCIGLAWPAICNSGTDLLVWANNAVIVGC